MPVERVTTRQITFFLVLTRVSIAISVIPVINLPPYNQDIWIMILVSILFTFIIMSPLLYLSNKFTEHSMVGFLKIIFGKTIGKIISILYGLFFMTAVINSVTIQSELVATTILTDASNIVIISVMILTCLYAASRGIIVITRGAECFAPISLFIIIGMIFLGINNANWSFLFPILKTSSFMDIILGAIRLTFYYNDIFILLMIVPELENKKDINKIFIISTIVPLLVLMVTVLIVQATLGIELPRHTNFPFLFYTRSISTFEVFERIESIFVIGWLIASLGRVVAFIYITARTFREIMNKEDDEKIIVTIVGLITGLISMYILNERSVIGIRKEFDKLYLILFIIFAVAIPILTCIVYFFRRKSLDKKEKPAA